MVTYSLQKTGNVSGHLIRLCSMLCPWFAFMAAIAIRSSFSKSRLQNRSSLQIFFPIYIRSTSTKKCNAGNFGARSENL